MSGPGERKVEAKRFRLRAAALPEASAMIAHAPDEQTVCQLPHKKAEVLQNPPEFFTLEGNK